MRSYADAVKFGKLGCYPFKIKWLPCGLPVCFTNNLLCNEDCKQFEDLFPGDEIMKTSMVYHTSLKQEIKSDYLRNSLGIREKSPIILNEIKKKIVSNLEQSLHTIDHFSQLIFREEETEWILYREGDFFKIHQDFERYVCDDMAPYVLLYGLENTISGGETIIYDGDLSFKFNQGSVKNGAVFFPGHLFHEAKYIYRGCKKCLKLEFYVFFHSEIPTLRCMDALGNYHSNWNLSFIKSIDCFLSSYSHFKSEDKKLITEMAPSLQKLSLSLHDRKRPSADENYDFLFPNMDFSFLHDFYSMTCFLGNSSSAFFLSKNANVWDLFFKSPTPHFLPLILLWTKSSKTEHYRLEDIYTKDGKSCYKNMDCSIFNNKEYIEYSKFSTMLQKNKIVEKEGRRMYYFRNENNKQKELLPTCHYNDVDAQKWSDLYQSLSVIKPNDSIHEPRFHSAHFQRQTYEMCNCEDAGFETYIEDVYITLYIQVRWILVRL